MNLVQVESQPGTSGSSTRIDLTEEYHAPLNGSGFPDEFYDDGEIAVTATDVPDVSDEGVSLQDILFELSSVINTEKVSASV